MCASTQKFDQNMDKISENFNSCWFWVIRFPNMQLEEFLRHQKPFLLVKLVRRKMKNNSILNMTSQGAAHPWWQDGP